MASRRPHLASPSSSPSPSFEAVGGDGQAGTSTTTTTTATTTAEGEGGKELFEACRNGDVAKVRRLVGPQNVNGRDTTGRKSSPLHFAAGTILSLF